MIRCDTTSLYSGYDELLYPLVVNLRKDREKLRSVKSEARLIQPFAWLNMVGMSSSAPNTFYKYPQKAGEEYFEMSLSISNDLRP